MNPIPPQAYTKEVLLKAYSWLQNQNNSIKDMASTPDVLVSLFLKANRDGDDVLERPSIQNFKKELKSLAEMMGDFDNPTLEEAMQAPQAAVAPKAKPQSAPSAFASPQAPTKATSAAQTIAPTHSTQSLPSMTGTAPTSTAPLSLQNLDLKSQFMIQEVKELMNLSSEDEALRLIIKLGHQKAKSILE